MRYDGIWETLQFFYNCQIRRQVVFLFLFKSKMCEKKREVYCTSLCVGEEENRVKSNL